jgi:excisionase family DNA binding protein
MTTRTAQSHSVDRLTYTVGEAAQLLGISRNSAYEAARRGEIPTIRVGRRILVPRNRLEELLACQ